MNKRDAVRTAQVQMAAVDSSVVEDGVWGGKSDAAYQSLSANMRDLIDSTALKNGWTIEQLRGPGRLVVSRIQTRAPLKPSASVSRTPARVEAITQPSTDRQLPALARVANDVMSSASGMYDRWVSLSQMRDITARVSGETGVPASTLMGFVELEAIKKTVGGVRSYDTLSINGSYKGLFQFNKAAWERARFGSSRLVAWSEAAWKDAYNNTLAAAAYLVMNTRAIRSFGYKGEITPQLAYLMHNQGARGAYERLKSGDPLAGNQSKDARAYLDGFRSPTIS